MDTYQSSFRGQMHNSRSFKTYWKLRYACCFLDWNVTSYQQAEYVKHASVNGTKVRNESSQTYMSSTQ